MRRICVQKKREAATRFMAAAAAGLLLSGLSSCAILPREEEYRQAPTVSEYSAEAFVTASCTRADVETAVTVSVSYVPIQTADLCYGISGKAYDEVYVRAGDSVKAGDVLARLDMGDLDSKIDDIKFSIEQYELQLRQSEENRELALQKTEIQYRNASSEDRAEAIAKVNDTYDSAKQSLEDKIYIAGLRLEDYESQKRARQLVAPFDGTVTYICETTPSEVSDKSKVMMTLADSSMSLFRGTTNDWDAFKSGTEAVVVTSKAEYEAWVRSEKDLGIAETDHIEGKRGYVYLALKETAYDLKAKDSGKVTIVTASHKDVLSVPKNAVSAINGEPVVYVPDENGLKTYRKVELGLVGDSRVEILSGLEEGERVVIN